MTGVPSAGVARPGGREQVRPGVALDRALIEHRLITVRRSVVYLSGMLPVSVDSLEEHEATGLVVERTFALVVDLAFAVNSHVVAACGRPVPMSYAASLEAAAEVGLFDPALLPALRPEGCEPHVLVQIHLDAEPSRVDAVVRESTAAFRAYADQVASWVAIRRGLVDGAREEKRTCAH